MSLSRDLLLRLLTDVSDMRQGLEESSGMVSQFGTRMKRAGEKISSTGRSLTRNLTTPIIGIGTAAVAAVAGFEHEMAKIEGLVGVHRQQVEAWKADVRGLAVQYGSSSKEAAEALFFITSAGVRGSEAMEVLEASLKANAAGLGEVKTVADLATSAMNAYGSDVLSATEATDVLTNAVREGKLEPRELAGAMGQVLPVASKLGVEFHEVGAAMAAMSRSGTNAATASTQLNSIMTTILRPTQEAEEALDGLGTSSARLRNTLREQGLLAVLQDLFTRFEQNDTIVNKFTGEMEGADAVAGQFFSNVRALRGAFDLMGAQADTTVQIFGNMTDSAGKLDEALGPVERTIGFKLKQALSTARNLLETIGHSVVPVVTDVLHDLVPLVSGAATWFSELSASTREAAVKGALLVSAIGPVLMVVGGLVSGLGTVVAGLSAFGTAILSVGKVIGSVMAKALLPLLSMPGFLVVAVGGLATAWVMNWEDIVRATSLAVYTIGQAIGNLWETTEKAFKAGVRFVVKLWFDLWTDIVTFTTGRIKDLAGALDKGLGSILPESWQKGLRAVEDIAGDMGDTAIQLKEDTLAAIDDMGTGVAEIIRNSSKDWSQSMVDGLGDSGDTAAELWDGVTSTLSEGMDSVRGLFDGLWNFDVPEITSTGFESIQGETKAGTDRMVQTVQTATDKISTDWNELADEIQIAEPAPPEKWESLEGTAQQAFGQVAQFAIKSARTGERNYAGMFRSIGNHLRNSETQWGEWAATGADAIATGIDTYQNAADESEAITQGWVNVAVGNYWQGAAQIVAGIVMMNQSAQTMFEQMNEVANKYFDQLQYGGQDAIDSFERQMVQMFATGEIGRAGLGAMQIALDRLYEEINGVMFSMGELNEMSAAVALAFHDAGTPIEIFDATLDRLGLSFDDLSAFLLETGLPMGDIVELIEQANGDFELFLELIKEATGIDAADWFGDMLDPAEDLAELIERLNDGFVLWNQELDRLASETMPSVIDRVDELDRRLRDIGIDPTDPDLDDWIGGDDNDGPSNTPGGGPGGGITGQNATLPGGGRGKTGGTGLPPGGGGMPIVVPPPDVRVYVTLDGEDIAAEVRKEFQRYRDRTGQDPVST